MVTLNDVIKQVDAQGADMRQLPIVAARINSRGGIEIKFEREPNNHRVDHISIEVVSAEEYQREYQEAIL